MGLEVERPAPGHSRRESPTAEEEPRLDQAVLARERGDLDEAASILQSWLKVAPTDDARLGCTLQTLVLFELGRYAQALRSLEQCQPPETLLDLTEHTYGELLRGLGRPLAAVAHFRAAARYHRSPVAPKAGFRLADALFEAGKAKQALRQYQKMLGTFPAYPERHGVRYRMAMCEAQLGRKRKAAEALSRVAREALPDSDAALAARRAFEELVESGVRRPRWTLDDELAWGSELRRMRRWADALTTVRPLCDDARSRSTKAECWYEVVLNLEALDFYDEAMEALTEARKYGNWAELVDAKVRLLRKLGRIEEAVDIDKRRAGGSKKMQGLQAAHLYFRDGVYDKAYKLTRKYSNTKFDRTRKWQLAWLAYRNGKYDRAERVFSYLVGKSGLGARMNALYWVGRARMKAGKKEEAIEAFTQVVRDEPASYYGVMAANRILELGDTGLYRELTGTRPEHVPSAEVRARLGASIHFGDADGTRVPATTGPSRTQVAQELLEAAGRFGQGYPELLRAHDRWRIGLDDEARMELRIALAERKRSGRASAKRLAQLASNLFVDYRSNKRGLWGSSTHRKLRLGWAEKRREIKRIEAARSTAREIEPILKRLMERTGDPYWQRRRALSAHWRLIRGVPTDATREVFKQAYPLPFERVLRRETGKHGLSPYLMGAIARVESGYNHLAISVAGARGLMQVMPVTGNLIALRTGDTEFAIPQLLEPQKSLAYGSWYMREVIHKFRGQEPLAFAGYNAGPHRVHQWVVRKGATTELDELVEEIPYSQAKRYVKAVVGYIAKYRRIYEDRADLWIGQKIDTRVRDNINW